MKTQANRFRPNPNVIVKILDDEAVLLHLKTEEYFTLDRSSTRMWQLLVEHGEIEPVIAEILNEFEVDEATLRRDLSQLIEDCKAEGLLDANK